MNRLMDKLMEAHRFWTTMKGDEVVDSQQMFPNCKARYTKCCVEDKEFWDKLDAKVKEYKPEQGSIRRTDDKVYHDRFKK